MFGQKQIARTQTEFVPTAGETALAAFEAVRAPASAAPAATYAPMVEGNEALVRSDLFRVIRSGVFDSMNASAVIGKTREQMKPGVEQLVLSIAERERLNITISEQVQIVGDLLNDMFGLGPIEPLLADETVTDVLVNGPDQVYVERHGRLELTAYKFRDNAHVVNVAQRIAAGVGRRVDESSPMVDARLADGSRVNAIIPPLAVDGPMVSIRKFARVPIGIAQLIEFGSTTSEMALVLEAIVKARRNVLISGGT